MITSLAGAAAREPDWNRACGSLVPHKRQICLFRAKIRGNSQCYANLILRENGHFFTIPRWGHRTSHQ